MEVTKTEKGAPMLLFEGYEYTIKFKGRKKIFEIFLFFPSYMELPR